jgi:hypothetical protein
MFSGAHIPGDFRARREEIFARFPTAKSAGSSKSNISPTWRRAKFQRSPDARSARPKNIRDGENGIQMKFLVALCRNDPTFRAAFFELCGGKLQFPPDVVATLAKLASWQENENAVRGLE